MYSMSEMGPSQERVAPEKSTTHFSQVQNFVFALEKFDSIYLFWFVE